MSAVASRPMFSFDKTEGKDEYLTPPHIIKPLGHFDLDPCAPITRPWSTADRHYTVNDDGLAQEWKGRIWLNPPYGNKTGMWMERLAKHGDGIALIFCRTETKTFFPWVWSYANAILFLKGRLVFYDIYGNPVKDKNGKDGSAGAPSCLIAYGQRNVEVLDRCGLEGRLVHLRSSDEGNKK